jgi:hypothetical protein
MVSTNDQVGMFGLGSKSPFAYTDTFSITAWLGGQKRVYIASISNNDIPEITHISTEPQGDEPQGIEIGVPVRMGDYNRFQAEIAKMVFASDVRPEVDGLNSPIPAPIAEGDGWRVIPDQYSYGQFAVRQGCVIYPMHDLGQHRYGWPTSYGHTLIVDVPIGSVEVTASRESVSMTEETQVAIEAARVRGIELVADWVSKIQFKNRLDHFQRSKDYSAFTKFQGLGNIKLVPDKGNKSGKVPACYLTVMASARKTSFISSVQNPSSLLVVVDRGEKVLRRGLRLAALYKDKGLYGRKQIVIVQQTDLPRLVRLTGIDRSQVVALSELPDVAVTRSGGGVQAGHLAAPKKVASDVYWIRKTGAAQIEQNIGGFWIKNADSAGYNTVLHFAEQIGIPRDKVVVLTDRQAEAAKLGEDRLLVNELKRRTARKVKVGSQIRTKLDIETTVNEYENAVSQASRTISTALGHAWGDARTIIVERAEKALADKVGPLPSGGTDAFETFLVALHEISGTPKWTRAELDATIIETARSLKILHGSDSEVLSNLLDFYMANNKETNES